MRRRIARALALPLLVFVAAVITAGCAKHAVQAPPSLAAATPAPVTHPEPPRAAPAPAPAPPPPAPELKSNDFMDARFDFDQYKLRDDARAALDADAKLLRDHPGTRITLEGHCDERGTAEYNQALGDRRAQVAKAYLIASGVDAARIETVSYGKERPFCTDHDETCWARNRCAHLVTRPGPA